MNSALIFQGITGIGSISATDPEGNTRTPAKGDEIFEGETIATHGQVSATLADPATGEAVLLIEGERLILVDETVLGIVDPDETIVLDPDLFYTQEIFGNDSLVEALVTENDIPADDNHLPDSYETGPAGLALSDQALDFSSLPDHVGQSYSGNNSREVCLTAADVLDLSQGSSLDISASGKGQVLVLESEDAYSWVAHSTEANTYCAVGIDSGLTIASVTVDNLAVHDGEGNPISG